MDRTRRSTSNGSSAEIPHNALGGSFKFSHMRMIAALEQHGSVSAAAATLNISQPAASRMVAEMEAAVGAKLLERMPRGVTLTAYGQALARRARTILAEIREADREIRDLRDGRGGTVNLGAVTAPAVDLAVPAIQEMRQRFPSLVVNVQVETSNVLARELVASRHDFIIARIPEDLNPRLFESRVIGIEKACLIVRRGHPLLSRGKVGLSVMTDFDWVMQPEGSLLRRMLEQQFRRRDIPLPERVLNTSSLLLTLVMVTRSDAIAAVSVEVARFISGKRGLGGAIDVLPVDFDIEVQPFSLITTRGRVLAPAAQTLYDAILQRAR
jgi:molybdate transport repressor ModE-like protein